MVRPAVTKSVKRKASNKPVVRRLSPKTSYAAIYHLAFLRAFETLPAAARETFRGDGELLTASVFASGKSKSIPYVDPMPRSTIAIVKFLIALHEHIVNRDSEVIAQIQRVEPQSAFARELRSCDGNDEIYAMLRDTANVDPKVARAYADAMINVIIALVGAHLTCVFVCRKIPKSYIAYLCYITGMSPILVSIAEESNVVKRKKAISSDEYDNPESADEETRAPAAAAAVPDDTHDDSDEAVDYATESDDEL